MSLYSENDLRDAQAELRKYGFMLGAGLAVCAALYVFATVRRSEAAMLAVLLAGFLYAVPLGMLRLYPALKYRNFVRGILQGLRREAQGRIDSIDPAAQVQDGVRVHVLQLRLEDGDTRLFYLNASKLEFCPQPGETVRLKSCGRHVAGFEA